MRSTFIVCLGLLAAFVSGCAYQGVIVAKRSHAAPFPNSLGIDGIYDFDLRDAAGQVHSQMVPPYVFFAYDVGDYFNDMAAPPVHRGKNLQAPPAPVEEELQEPPVPYGPEPLRTRKPTDRPYHPVRTTTVHHHSHAARIAQNHHRKHRSRIAQTHHRKHRVVKSAKVHHRSHHHAKVASRRHRKRHHSAS